MVAGEWPPKVWHGVIDPNTGEDIPPVKMGDLPSFVGPKSEDNLTPAAVWCPHNESYKLCNECATDSLNKFEGE